MKTDVSMVRTMPFYLVIQATLMLSTFLDSPLYLLSYRAGNAMVVTPWVVAWLFLTVTGLVFGISALVRQTFRQNLEPAQRLNLAGGYLLGALAGLVALGIRFLPLLPRAYFYFIGAFALLLALIFFYFKYRSSRKEELFP